MRATVHLLTVLLLALTALAFHRTAVANQATPAATAGLGPALGDRVRVENSDGDEVAALSVIRLDDPAPLRDPDPGFRAIDVDVAIENVAQSTFYLGGHEFQVIDANGVVYDDVRAELDDTRLDDPTTPFDSESDLEPGQAVRLSLTFQLPENAVLAQIVRDTGDHRQTLLDLRPSRLRYGDTIPIVGTTGDQFGTIAVSAPTDPFVPPPGTRSIAFPGGWQRDVTFPVSVQNTGEVPFPIYISDFAVLDTHGALTQADIPVGYEEDAASAFLQLGDANAVAPGATVSGLVKVRIAKEAELVAVIFSPTDPRTRDGSYSLTVAESGLQPLPPSAPPLFAPEDLVQVQAGDVTPGCEGVAAWAEDLFARLDAVGSALGDIPEDGDLASLDPALLRQAAGDLRDDADAQAASNPPAVAADANAVAVDLLLLLADALDAEAAAVEAGDQTAIDATAAESGDALDAFFEGEFDPTFEALAAACPELNEPV